MTTPIKFEKLELGHTYTVKEGGLTVATGKLVKLHNEIHPYGEGHKLPAAQIESFTQGGVYSADEYTFEEVKAPNPAGPGLSAVRALRKGVGRGRKTRKHKRRARKTRRSRK